MVSGLLALFDDVAAFAKIASASLDDVVKMSAKAAGRSAGIVIDDAAVTPRYVVGDLSRCRAYDAIGIVVAKSDRYFGDAMGRWRHHPTQPGRIWAQRAGVLDQGRRCIGRIDDADRWPNGCLGRWRCAGGDGRSSDRRGSGSLEQACDSPPFGSGF